MQFDTMSCLAWDKLLYLLMPQFILCGRGLTLILCCKDTFVNVSKAFRTVQWGLCKYKVTICLFSSD